MAPSPAVVGYHCSHEQWPPSALLEHLVRAESAGFQAGMCSDHFHPWSERQGHSGFAWSWLGAALARTRFDLGTVCAPGQRYHPAVIAQAAATLAEMYPERLWVALGSGEALNESITGDPWPAKDARNARLQECASVMRRLWAGETVDHDGQVRVKDATLYTRPEKPPLIVGAALTPETARFVGGWADALVTVAMGQDALRKMVDAFRAGGGEGKPMYLQVALAYGKTEDEALHVVHDQWRQSALEPDDLADLPTPRAFDAKTADTTIDDVRGKVRTCTDLGRLADQLHRDAEAGFQRLYLHNLNRRRAEEFIDACAERVLPEFAGAGQASPVRSRSFR